MSTSTYVENFVALLHTLGLAEGSYKPFPSNASLLAYNNAGSNAIGYGYPNVSDGAGFLGTPINTTSSDLSYYNTTFHSTMGFNASVNTQCSVAPYDAPPLGNQAFWAFDATAATVYRYRRQQSVNLGSWFVQENWMVPSLFTCASDPQAAEIDVASGWGSLDNARAVLERHWDTFINQTDFDYLASIGINTVRMPIGYWTLGPTFLTGTPFEPYASVYTNVFPRFVRAINMAAQSGIGVLVDLHGAVGSQNGQAHSGISDGQTRLFNNPAYMDKTVAALVYLAKQLQNVTNIVGIEIVNEPVNVPGLSDFYTRAIGAMRQRSTGGQSLPLYIHDGFNLDQYSTYLSARSDFVVEDHHSYFVFSPADASEPASQHTNDVQGAIAGEFEAVDSKDRDNLVIGEWSCALTAQSLATQADPDAARRQFCTVQMDVYTNTSAGWSFWSYTKEDCDTDHDWCFKAAVGKSLPETFFSYGKPPPMDSVTLQRIYAAVADMTVPSQADMVERLESAWTLLAEGSNETVSWNATDAQQRQSSIRGYTDGYQTAKIFTQHGWSRLGFAEQYIRDSLSAMTGGSVPEGTESYYRSGFKAGLTDGEGVVFALLS